MGKISDWYGSEDRVVGKWAVIKRERILDALTFEDIRHSSPWMNHFFYQKSHKLRHMKLKRKCFLFHGCELGEGQIHPQSAQSLFAFYAGEPLGEIRCGQEVESSYQKTISQMKVVPDPLLK
jgi:hypothetical protein